MGAKEEGKYEFALSAGLVVVDLSFVFFFLVLLLLSTVL
jgi:hypothetical protein